MNYTESGRLRLGYLEIPVPLVGEGYARISVPARMSQRAWDQLMSVLNAYKPGIVSEETEQDSKAADE